MKALLYILIILLIAGCSASIYLQNRANHSSQAVTTKQSFVIDSTNLNVNVKRSK